MRLPTKNQRFFFYWLYVLYQTTNIHCLAFKKFCGVSRASKRWICAKASMKSIVGCTGLISLLPDFCLSLIKSFHHFYRTQEVVILGHDREWQECLCPISHRGKAIGVPSSALEQPRGATHLYLHHLLLSELMCLPGAKAKHSHFPFSLS